MKKLLTSLLLCGLCSAQAQAWNAPLHMAVVELALDQLSERQAQQLNNVAYDLIVELDRDRRLNLMRQYQETSWLAQLSVIPDWDRDILLEDLFQRYGLEVPAPLADQRARNTAHWHYVNRALASEPGAAQCQLAEPVNLVSVFPLLQQSYQVAASDKERALLLAFIVHLVADAHQPLHNVTQATNDCQHDLGGNNFCAVQRQLTQRCEENLHELWDSALGLVDDLELVGDMAQRIALVMPAPNLLAELDMGTWSEESYRFGQLVYSTSVNRNPDSSYLNEGRAISAERLHLAAMRLSRILGSL